MPDINLDPSVWILGKSNEHIPSISFTPESNTSDRIEIANVRGVSYHHWRGTIQEVIFFPSSTKSDHTAIENSINSFYSLF